MATWDRTCYLRCRVPGARVPLKRVLVVYWWPTHLEMRSAVETHLHALDSTGTKVTYLNAFVRPPRWVRLGRWDMVVLHTTFLCLRWDPTFAGFRQQWSWLRALDCPKIALPQDEYDHAFVLDEWLAELGVDVVFSTFDAETRSALYPTEAGGARMEAVLTGYIDIEAAAYCDGRAQPAAERPFDIVYRALELPYWFGSHGQLKHRIAAATLAHASTLGLACDISTQPGDTIYGLAWLDFVMSGRAIIGAESGSSVLDARGGVRQHIQRLLAADPTLTFEQVAEAMPDGWDAYRFFAISPRHLEAVIARTCQVLVEGSYSGILEPWRHYIPVRRDLSDLDAALGHLGDEELVSTMVDTAYREIYLEGPWTTRHLGKRLIDASGEAPHMLTAARTRAAVLLPLVRKAEEAAFRSALSRRLEHIRGWSTYRTNGTGVYLLSLAVRSLLNRPALTVLIMRATLKRPQRSVVGRPLWRDLLRLGVLDSFYRHQRIVGSRWTVVTERDGDKLTIRSCRAVAPSARPSSPPPGSAIRQIVWDHSSVALTALADPLRPELGMIAIGKDGRYEFAALSEIARAFPEAPWERVLKLTG